MCFWVGVLRPFSAATGIIMLVVNRTATPQTSLNFGHIFMPILTLTALWQCIGIIPGFLMNILRPEGLRWGKAYFLADIFVSFVSPSGLHFSLWGSLMPLGCYLYLQNSDEVKRLFAERNPLEI
jgi:hypothetical protein